MMMMVNVVALTSMPVLLLNMMVQVIC
jgi:hypothetical protein